MRLKAPLLNNTTYPQQQPCFNIFINIAKAILQKGNIKHLMTSSDQLLFAVFALLRLYRSFTRHVAGMICASRRHPAVLSVQAFYMYNYLNMITEPAGYAVVQTCWGVMVDPQTERRVERRGAVFQLNTPWRQRVFPLKHVTNVRNASFSTLSPLVHICWFKRMLFVSNPFTALTLHR